MRRGADMRDHSCRSSIPLQHPSLLDQLLPTVQAAGTGTPCSFLSHVTHVLFELNQRAYWVRKDFHTYLPKLAQDKLQLFARREGATSHPPRI